LKRNGHDEAAEIRRVEPEVICRVSEAENALWVVETVTGDDEEATATESVTSNRTDAENEAQETASATSVSFDAVLGYDSDCGCDLGAVDTELHLHGESGLPRDDGDGPFRAFLPPIWPSGPPFSTGPSLAACLARPSLASSACASPPASRG